VGAEEFVELLALFLYLTDFFGGFSRTPKVTRSTTFQMKDPTKALFFSESI
jgi:hypothetical protein